MQTPDNTNQPNPQQTNPTATNEKVAEALQQAEKDIEQDPDFQQPGPTADMDEGEIARFEAGEGIPKDLQQ